MAITGWEVSHIEGSMSGGLEGKEGMVSGGDSASKPRKVVAEEGVCKVTVE